MIAHNDRALAELFAEFAAAKLSTRSRQTAKLHRLAHAQFAEFLEREPRLSDLNDATVGEWLAWLAPARSPQTVNNRRDYMLHFWRWCHRHGHTHLWPDVPKMAEPELLPRGWSVEQIRRLLAACAQEQGTFGGIPAAAWWIAWHRVIFDTGERSGAMLQLRWDWLDWDAGELDVPGRVRKAGKAMRYALRRETLDSLRLITEPQRLLIFPTDGGSNGIYHRTKRICRRAGLPYRPPKALRISFASYLEANGGNATEALKHSGRAVTEKHYIDVSIAGRPRACDRLPEI
jgi:integrase